MTTKFRAIPGGKPSIETELRAFVAEQRAWTKQLDGRLRNMERSQARLMGGLATLVVLLGLLAAVLPAFLP